MRPPLNLPALNLVARELLTRSEEFEPGDRADSPQAAGELLSGLEQVTRRSLPLIQPTAPQSTAEPHRTAPPQDEAPAVRYATSKQEYKPALLDQSIIEALLDFHKRSGPEGNAAPSTSFVAPRIPEIQIQPKTRHLYRQRQ